MADMGILTISSDGLPGTFGQESSGNWHEIMNGWRNGKILTGTLSGIEKMGEWNVAVVFFASYRILIPMEEMGIDLNGDGREQADTLNRQLRIANNMLGAQIDFIIRKAEEETGSIVASRRDAMEKKRRTFYLPEEASGKMPLIYPGRRVEARVIAVAPKVVRLELFGVEVSVRIRDMCQEWLLDASEKYAVGDVVLVTVTSVEGMGAEELRVAVNAKGETDRAARASLMKCSRQGKYSGIVTDTSRGIFFLRLDIGVNAVAHSTNTQVQPAKGDRVGFVVTRINEEAGSAEGIITRMIRQAGKE